MATDDFDSWHWDKRVPVGLLVMIVIQTITFVYVGTSWKSDTDHRLSSLEKSDDTRSPQGNRILILEQKFDFIKDALGRLESNQSRMEQKIDKKDTP